MRDAKARLSSIGGALLAISIVLAAALHLAERSRDNAASAVAPVGMREQPVVGAPGIVPVTTLLDEDTAAQEERIRIVAHVLIPQLASNARIEDELAIFADGKCRSNPRVGAIMVLGYGSAAEFAALGDRAPWTLVWSPDGRGWDGTARDDFDKHVYGPKK